MTKTFTPTHYTLTTNESDIYAPTNKAMTMLIQAVNTTGSAVTCELWVTDGSNVHKASIFPSQSIAAHDGISDTSKHIIPSGYKIRGLASAGSAIMIEVSAIEGM